MKNEYNIDKNDQRIQIKSLIALRALTIGEVKALINKKYNKNDRADNLSRKLIQKTLRLSEFIELMDVLDFEIILRDKK